MRDFVRFMRMPLIALICAPALIGCTDEPAPPQQEEKAPEMEQPKVAEGPCLPGWEQRSGYKLTGYFLPLEEDYFGDNTEITVDDEPRLVRADFLEQVDDLNKGGEGWGQTRDGDFIGHYGPNETWISSPNPLDSKENPLKVGMVAVDPNNIPHNSVLMIPGLPQLSDELGPHTQFVASDVGTFIKGSRIDVFTGTGKPAEQATLSLTTDDFSAIVCIKR